MSEHTQEEIELFVNGYIQAALFAGVDDSGEPLDANFSGSDIDSASFEMIKRDCLEFLRLVAFPLRPCDMERYGMDFFYARNGHGIGFLDRDMNPNDVKELFRISKTFKEQGFYEDGKTIGVE